jgi:hypothetical protein
MINPSSNDHGDVDGPDVVAALRTAILSTIDRCEEPPRPLMDEPEPSFVITRFWLVMGKGDS